MKKLSAIAYVEPKDDGHPSQSLAQLCADVFDGAGLRNVDNHFPAITKRAAKGRTKVRVTVTVERVD